MMMEKQCFQVYYGEFMMDERKEKDDIRSHPLFGPLS